jgi:DNA-binding transcriptional LysR family regulator
MRLRSVDLNLLPVLRQLLEDRNITRAAEALALTQPAVSKALARLRAIFDDPLLVRDGRRMILTPRAEQLQPQVEEQCRELERLWVKDGFVAATSRRQFSISCTDYEDLVIAADEGIDSFATADVIKVPLLHEDFVTVVGLDHPLATGAGGANHPVRQLVYRPGVSPLALSLQMQPKQPNNPLATLSTFTVLPILALLTGTAAFVPRMVATRFAGYLPLTIVEGVGPRWTVNISMAWHRRWQDDEGHRWLRNLIIARCGELG